MALPLLFHNLFFIIAMGIGRIALLQRFYLAYTLLFV